MSDRVTQRSTEPERTNELLVTIDLTSEDTLLPQKLHTPPDTR